MHHDVETGHYVAGGRRSQAFSCSLSLVTNYEERETSKEEKIYLDEKLVAAQSAFWTLDSMRSWWQNSEEKTRRASEITLFRKVQE